MFFTVIEYLVISKYLNCKTNSRVLILLVYMGRKSLWRGGVVECVSRLVSRLLPLPLPAPSPPSSPAAPPPLPVWQQADLSLLAWLLVYLAALLDTAQPKDAC